MNLLYFVIIAFVISLLIGWVSIPNIVIIAKQKRLFDKPSARKVHTAAIPRLGGVAFFPATIIAFCFSLGIRYAMDLDISILKEGEFISEFMLLCAGMFMLYLVGLRDDLVGATPRIKFIVQGIAAAMLITSGLYIRNLEGLFGIYEIGKIWGVALTMLVVVFAINSFNLIDGVDGLCSGLGLVVLSVFGVWFLYLGDYVYSMLVFSMVGIVGIFFVYNVGGRRLKVFMGDTGSLSLGLMVTFCALKIIGCRYPDGCTEVVSPLSIVVGLLFVPLFDTVRVFAGRLAKGKSPFYPDKTHIHHKLLNLGLNHIQSTGVLICSTLFFFICNIILTQLLGINITFVLLINILCGVTFNVWLNFRIKKIVLHNERKSTCSRRSRLYRFAHSSRAN